MAEPTPRRRHTDRDPDEKQVIGALALVVFLVAVLMHACSPPVQAQDGVDIGLYIDGQPLRLTNDWCMLVRNPDVPWGPPPPNGYAIQIGAGTQPTSGRIYVNPGGVSVVLPVIMCFDRLFTNDFEE